MMDLSEDCPHCEAKVGEICTKECEVNGKYLIAIERALWKIGFTLENIIILDSNLN